MPDPASSWAVLVAGRGRNGDRGGARPRSARSWCWCLMAQGLFAAGVGAAFAMAIGTAVANGASPGPPYSPSRPRCGLRAERIPPALVARGFEFVLRSRCWPLASRSCSARVARPRRMTPSGATKKPPRRAAFLSSVAVLRRRWRQPCATCDSRQTRGQRSRGPSLPRSGLGRRSATPRTKPTRVLLATTTPRQPREDAEADSIAEQIDHLAAADAEREPIDIQEIAGPGKVRCGRRRIRPARRDCRRSRSRCSGGSPAAPTGAIVAENRSAQVRFFPVSARVGGVTSATGVPTRRYNAKNYCP